MLLAAPATQLPRQGMAPSVDYAPLTVRLAPAPARAPDFPESPPPEARRPQLPAPPAGNSGDLPGSRATLGTAAVPAAALSLPELPDPNYYPARDLDDYPRPLAPLQIGRPARAGAGELRLELLIDERGVVRDVVFAGPVQPGDAEEELRATLAATPFMPARRHGRAVKSRVLMSINFEIGNR